MPRPCQRDHPLRPDACRLCHWYSQSSDLGAFHRRLWGEPAPGGRAGPSEAGPVGHAREIVPGLPDPIQAEVLRPVPQAWPFDPDAIERHRAALFRLARADLPSPGARSGAGVLLLGGGKFWPGIVVSVEMLRDSGSRLPVQIWHRGDAEPIRRADLAGVAGVTIHDLTALSPKPRILGPWESKTLALLASGWERVFYIDADAYAVRDPAPLLERLSADEPFLYWHDIPGPHSAVRWPTWGLAGSTVPAIQGGHLAIHVPHAWREVVLAHWLNQHSDFTYAHQYGDQDSWRVAFTLTGGAHACLGPARWDAMAFVCNLGGEPMVIHRCQSKMFFPEDVPPGDVHSNRRLAYLPGEAKAWAFFDALRPSPVAEAVFARVYESGLWGPDQISGGGSTEPEARPYLTIVNRLITLFGWRRVVDLGSGDGWVASRLEAPEVVGVDCYSPHVERLRREVPGVAWVHLDLDRDREELPSGDVAFLKDVLLHWPNRVLYSWLEWARRSQKWRWIVCTQDHTQHADWQDCELGGYRGLDCGMEPLRSLGFVPLCSYLHKSVLMLEVEDEPAGVVR